MEHKILSGKRGIIFGALNEESIAWHIAEKCFKAGATFTLTNKPAALRIGNLQNLADRTQSTIIPAEITDMESLDNLVRESVQVLGGPIDFVLHSVGMSRNIRKQVPYQSLSYQHLFETLDVSAVSLHRIIKALLEDEKFLNEHASIVSMSYIASQRTFKGYTDMAEAKALLESITRNFGPFLAKAKKARINAISQSPTLTSAGSGISNFSDFYDFAELTSPLGNASAEECANLCTMMFSDYTRKVTMQTIYHDGGFSSVGLSESIAACLPTNKTQ